MKKRPKLKKYPGGTKKKTTTPLFKHGGRKLPKFPNGYEGTMMSEYDDGSGLYAGTEEGYSAGDPNRKAEGSSISSNDAVAIGGAAIKGATNVYNTQNNPYASSEQKGLATRDAVYGTGTAVAGAINPALGAAMGLVDSGSKMVRAETDKTNSTTGEIENKNASYVASAAGAALDPAGAMIELYSDPNATDLEKVAGALTGGLSEAFTGRHQKQVESDAKKNIASQNATKKARDEQQAQYDAQQQASFNNMMASYNQPKENPGLSSDPNRTSMYAAYGGVKYSNGGLSYENPNARIEKQEMVRFPYGGTDQVDVGTHESGNDAEVNLPSGTQIFSDRLKDVGSKLTFAKEAAKYKIKEVKDRALTATEQLVNSVRQKKLDMIFQAQEMLKQSKVAKYAEKMGVKLPGMNHQMPDGQMMPGAQHQMMGPESGQEGMEYKMGGMHKLPKYAYGYETEDPTYSTNGYLLTNNTPMEVPEDPKFRRYKDPISIPKIQSMIPEAEIEYQDEMQFRGAAPDDFSKDEDYPETSSMIEEYRRTNPGLYSKYGNSKDPVKQPYLSNYQKARMMGAGAGAAQMAGSIYGLATNKKERPVVYKNGEVRYLDSTQALADADIQNKITRGALSGAADGNAGTFMKNAIQAGAQNSLAKARIRMAYDASNAGTYNAAQAEIAANANKSMDATAMNEANYRNLNTKYVGDIGSSLSNIYRDDKSTKQEYDYLEFIKKEYPQAYIKYMNENKSNKNTTA
jgi:hypothetical protein